MGVEPKIGGKPKVDGLFHGKPYEQMDDLGGHMYLIGFPVQASIGVPSLKKKRFGTHCYRVFSAGSKAS